MDVTIDLNKTVNQNAAIYFEKSKKAKRKIIGAEEVVKKTEKELTKLLKEKDLFEKKEKERQEQEAKFKDRKKEWFEKFRWFYTSTNLLVVGGRDATSNEIVIKKHAEPGDLVFHTDMAGSPFFVLKTKNKKPTKATLREVADATATFSRAWKLGLQSQDVFYVDPEQVSKKQESGTTHLAKGAFMIYGKTTYVENKTNLCIGLTKDNAIMAGPCDAIKKHCTQSVQLLQGEEKASSIAKKIQHVLDGDLDEIIRALPAGSFKMKK